jgi:hypothetical protein
MNMMKDNSNVDEKPKDEKPKDEAPGVRRLREAHEAWVKCGSKMPSAKEVKPAIKAYDDARKEVEQAEGHLAKAREHLSTAVERLVRLTGRGRVDLGGKLGVVIPMARGETLFLRPETVRVARKVGDG